MPPLPELCFVPEGMSDDEVHEYIIAAFDSAIGESISFNDELSWLLKIIIARASDRVNVLFHCGLIFMNPYVVVNATVLSTTFSYPANDWMTKRLRIWPQVQWGGDERVSLVSMYDPDADPRGWALRQPPPDSPVFQTSVYRPMAQIVQRVPELNRILGPVTKKTATLNLIRMKIRRFGGDHETTVAPWQWSFDSDALYKLDLS